MTAATADVVAAHVPQRSWRSEMRAVRIICGRDLIRFRSNPAQILTWLIQPLLFLFAIGSGLESLSSASTDGVSLSTFIFPGVLCMSVLFSAMISAASLVWDRELGFLQELKVAPVSRSSIILGKTAGGALIALAQGVILLVLAPLVDVPYDPVLLLGALALLALLAFSVTSFGVLVAVRIKQPQSFTAVMQMLVFPMFFLSGALFPVSDLPRWLEILNRINPLTYAVDAMRHLVFNHLDDVSDSARATLDPGVTWFGWQVPVMLEVGIVLAIGLVALGLAIRKFGSTE